MTIQLDGSASATFATPLPLAQGGTGGTTDYVELFGYQGAAAQNTIANALSTYFQAVLVKAI